MHFLYSVLLYQFVLSTAIPPTIVEPLHHKAIRLVASTEHGKSTTVILTPTDQKLANEHLPVWIIHEDNPDGLTLLENVMQDVGPFTMYHDTEATAAAIYFQKQQKFYGTIDSRQVINGLFWDPDENPGKGFCTSGVINRNPSRFFTDIIPGRDSRVSVQLENHMSNEILDQAQVDSVPCDNAPGTNYVETLVIVNHDMVQRLQTHPHDYESIVTYVMTLMNSNDVLYSKIADPIIKFNLAGIIIATKPDAFPAYISKRCDDTIPNVDGGLDDHLDVRCTNEFIRTFCTTHKQTIPPGSYDIAILLTSYGLHLNKYDPETGETKFKKLGGLAESINGHYYELMRAGTMRTLVATVSDQGEYESFPILAHEIAHLLTVDHDEVLGEKHRLMQPSGKHNRRSLSWSHASIRQLKTFFSSRDSCTFRNKPRALHSPGPRRVFTADEQCECYGFKAAKIGILDRIKGGIGLDCDENIQCDDVNGDTQEGPIFMDGTPCGPGKVCWAERCETMKFPFHLPSRCGSFSDLIKHENWLKNNYAADSPLTS